MRVISSRSGHRASAILMDTDVTVRLVAPASEADAERRVREVFAWFRQVEAVCSRFEPDSEVMCLSRQVGRPWPVSPLLYELVRFALTLARETGGAFDPAIGGQMERLGFDRSYRTGRRIVSPDAGAARATYRDIRIDPKQRTISLNRPVVIDLGALSKGFAIDLAARALAGTAGYAIDAGGDLYLRGRNEHGGPWRVGVRNPRAPGEILEVLSVTDAAVCTSAGYARVSTTTRSVHHLIDPRTGRSNDGVASVTVIAPTGLLADGLATAAFVLGPSAGRRLLERHGVEGLILSGALERTATPGFAAYCA